MKPDLSPWTRTALPHFVSSSANVSLLGVLVLAVSLVLLLTDLGLVRVVVVLALGGVFVLAPSSWVNVSFATLCLGWKVHCVVICSSSVLVLLE